MPVLTTTTLGRFCREVAGGLDDIDVLLREWQVTPEEFELIKETPAFKHEMAVVVQEMQEMGTDAGYVFRMKSLAEELLPDVVRMAKAAETPTSQKFEIIRWVSEMARLKEKPAKNSDAQGPRGPSVIFQFGAGLPIGTMKVTAVAEDEPPPRVQHTYDVAPMREPAPTPGIEGFE